MQVTGALFCIGHILLCCGLCLYSAWVAWHWKHHLCFPNMLGGKTNLPSPLWLLQLRTAILETSYNQHPQAYLMAAVFSMTGYLGLNFVLVLVQSFGALVAVIGTSVPVLHSAVCHLRALLYASTLTGHWLWLFMQWRHSERHSLWCCPSCCSQSLSLLSWVPILATGGTSI